MRPAAIFFAVFLLGCMPQPDRPSLGTGGRGGTSGDGGTGDDDGSGGIGGSGGSGVNGSGGQGAGGGGGNSAGGSGGSGGTGGSILPDAGATRPDAHGIGGAPDAGANTGKDGPAATTGTLENVRLVTANCIYCHSDASKRVDLQDQGLYMRLVNVTAAHAPSTCMIRTLIVPHDPSKSLLYLKVAGKVPPGCGAPMPYKKPMISALELGFILDWINAGAPPQ